MRIVIPLMFALGLVAAAPAAAQAAGVAVSYNIDVGPLTVSVVRFSVDVSGSEVHSRARIKPAGMSRVFSEFGATADAETRFEGAAPQPVSYKIVRDHSDKRKVTTVDWNGATPTYDPPIDNPDRKAKVDSALAAGAVDPVTAVLRMGTEGVNPCSSKHRVFDGREVYELALTDNGKGKLDGDDVAWNGPVERCTVRWTPVAGRQADNGVPGDSYDVAFAPVADLDNGRKLWLPVEMSGRLRGLSFRGYITKLDSKAGAAAD